MVWIKENWFLLALIAFFMSGNAFQMVNPKIEIQKIETVVKDTSAVLELKKVKAELSYLRANPEIKYKKAKASKPEILKDTVFIEGEQFIVPNFTASIDTLINKDSLRVSYEYPLNQFDIFIKKHYTQTTEKITVVEKPLFSFTHGISAGVFIAQDGIVRPGIGYTLQISF